MANQVSTMTFKVPASLRVKMEERARAEERTLSGFLRFHLGRMFDATEEEQAETEVNDADEIETARPQ